MKAAGLVLITIVCAALIYASVVAFVMPKAATTAALVMIVVIVALQVHLAQRTRLIQAAAVNLGVWALFALAYLANLRFSTSSILLVGLALAAAAVSTALYAVISRFANLISSIYSRPRR